MIKPNCVNKQNPQYVVVLVWILSLTDIVMIFPAFTGGGRPHVPYTLFHTPVVIPLIFCKTIGLLYAGIKYLSQE